MKFLGVPSGKLRRYFSFQNFTDLFKILAGAIKALFIIGRLKPDLVFSKGGFVSVPPVFAAGVRKVTVISHESDVTPGLATRLNSRFSEKIFVSYKQTLSYIAPEKGIVTGNPVRAAIFNADAEKGRKAAGASDRQIIMVIGGSQGALQINRLVEALIPELTERYVVVHQARPENMNLTAMFLKIISDVNILIWNFLI